MKNVSLEQYIAYWDNWHKEWFVHTKTTKKIQDWKIPHGSGRQENIISKYFPEPYYYVGRGDSELKAIFININPGEGGASQDIEKKESSEWYGCYQKVNHAYSTAMTQVLEQKNGTAAFFSKRINWANELMKTKGGCQPTEVLCADLIPWHTKKESDIMDYLRDKDNRKAIINRVIMPLLKVAKTNQGVLKNKIIVRGIAFMNLINHFYKLNPLEINKRKLNEKIKSRKLHRVKQFIVLDGDQFLDKFNSFLTVINFGGVDICIFSGGASMELPKAEYMVYPINNAGEPPMMLKEFLGAKDSLPSSKAKVVPS